MCVFVNRTQPCEAAGSHYYIGTLCTLGTPSGARLNTCTTCYYTEIMASRRLNSNHDGDYIRKNYLSQSLNDRKQSSARVFFL